ncbi:MAG: hypothetical protein EOP04_01805 [Proteobacteria bacterium]|nr:MAG: hypothetical protein EOP04_01805 [Pseudomonadota bacterium]
MSHRENITRIKAVYNALEELGPEVVFVGGATVSLYADRPTGETRPTDDVDILVELLQYNGYATLEEKLRRKGFVNDAESGVICRFRLQGLIVDVMPTNDVVLGFANRWYPEGHAQAIPYQLEEGYTIKIFSPVFFLATKLEAFNDRGAGDGRTSSDFEDIVFMLSNRTTIWEELRDAEHAAGAFVKESFGHLLHNSHLAEWISCHLEYSEQARVPRIINFMRAIS